MVFSSSFRARVIQRPVLLQKRARVIKIICIHVIAHAYSLASAPKITQTRQAAVNVHFTVWKRLEQA